MPRPERHLDPDADAIQRFAFDLRELRQKAGGPAYRQLARSAHYSPATLADAAGGRRLPSLAVTLAYVRACGGDEREWETRWRKMAHEPDAFSGTAPDSSAPYVGLAAFHADDADRFFGRDKLVSELRALVARRRMVGVFGASGSGKSSLLRAGLVGKGEGHAVVFTPGADPVEECAVQLAAALGGSAASWRDDLAADPANLHLRIRQAMAHDDHDLLLVVDQFEETITLCPERDRTWLVRAMVHAATAESSRVRIVLGTRADFYVNGAPHPELSECLRGGHVHVGSMTSQELREAVTGPAARAGYQVETALVARIVADAAGQPAVLPLVSHALLETWHRRHGVMLTLAGYEAAGGIQHAVARTAEDAYLRLAPGQRHAARILFLRLIAIGEGTGDTGRRISVEELDHDRDTTAALDRLTEARLLVVDHDGIQMVHEALIRHWPRLADWLAANRDGLRVQRHLSDATTSWRTLSRDSGSLYRGTRLALAREWTAAAPDMLTSREREFLDASIDADRAEHRRTRRRNRQLRWLAASLGALLLLATGVTLVAVRQGHEATAQQLIARSRQMATEAEEIAPKDVGRAISLALQAYHASPTIEARSMVLSLASRPSHTARLPHAQSRTPGGAVSPDRRLLATSSATSGEVELWDLTTRTRLSTLEDSASGTRAPTFTAFRFSADGSRFAATDTTGTVVVWDIGRRTVVDRYVPPDNAIGDGLGSHGGVAISPDLRLVAFVDRGHVLAVHDITTRTVLLRQSGTGWASTTIGFSPDGRYLTATGDDATVSLWDTSAFTRVVLPAGRTALSAVAVNADSTRLATGGVDGTVTLWDIPSRTRLAELPGHAGRVTGLVFRPRTAVLISSGVDNRVLLWETTQATRLAQLSTDEPSGLGGVAISADGETFAVFTDEATLLWDRADLPLVGHTDAVRNLMFDQHSGNLFSLSADRLHAWNTSTRRSSTDIAVPRHVDSTFSAGTGLLAIAEDPRSDVVVWSLANQQRTEQQAKDVHSLALSPTTSVIAADNGTGTVQLWDVTQPAQTSQLPAQSALPGALDSLAFSPDGRTLATSQDNQPIRLWDVQTRALIAELPRQGDISRLTFSPDGRRLVSTGRDGVARVWDIRSRTRVAELAGHTGAITSSAFTDDGRYMITVSTDKKTVVWDMVTYTPWACLAGHTGEIFSVATSPDNAHVATGGGDNTITLWSIDPMDSYAYLCRRLARDFPTTPQAPGCPPQA
nr:AAA family ATPase [Kibdelosporangium sp. MJ126-NF4]CEL18687.1 High-affnity carbon uptake protein Hat/HatR [Kibdelosporangium sp. MJ126-NF4]CTQ98171.1 High-affnity carbon uptake protein Hat/HatR [Kibdelosporangium sp. MJ126-NF4]